MSRITTGFFISTISGLGYCILCYKAYQTNPCGWYGSTDPKCVEEGLVSPISLWWAAIPYALGGFSELFINVPGMNHRVGPNPCLEVLTNGSIRNCLLES